jgi:hypothetical protein
MTLAKPCCRKSASNGRIHYSGNPKTELRSLFTLVMSLASWSLFPCWRLTYNFCI